MHDPLTPLERRVYHYLIDFLAEHTYQPSIREIARRFRIKSTKSVAEIITALAEKGFVEAPKGRSRGVTLIGYSSIARTQPVPIYEKVNPAEPYYSEEHRSRFLAVDRSLLPSDEVILLRAPDDTMRLDGILAHDLLLVDQSMRAREADLVVARVGSEVLVRTIGHRGATVTLKGTGGASDVRIGPNEDFAVLGVVVGVIRAFLHDHEDDVVPPDDAGVDRSLT